MSAADEAYKAAQEEIARVKARNQKHIDFYDLRAPEMLHALPPQISELTDIETLDLQGTQITDLSPIRGLGNLQELTLNGSRVSDLEPIRGLKWLQSLSLRRTPIDDLELIRDLTGIVRLDISDTNISDLSPLQDFEWLQELFASHTRVEDLSALATAVNLQRLSLSQTKVTTIEPLRGRTQLHWLDLTGSLVSDLRPLLEVTGLRKGAEEKTQGAGLGFRESAVTRTNSELLNLSKIRSDHIRTLKTLDYLATLPPWPELLPGMARGKATQQKTPKHLKRLSLSDARHILENNYPMVRDRCQAVVQEIDEGLAIQQTRIPNDERALADHSQVTQSLTVAKAAMIGIHDALPEDFTDQEIDEEIVGRFKQAFDAAIDRLQSAAAYIDRPDHTPTYGGLLKLGCAGSVASVLAIAPGVTLGAALPAIYALLYGPEAAKALKGMITAQTAEVPTGEEER